MSKGMLIDLSKCLGCRGCQVACKQKNDLPGLSTTKFDGQLNSAVKSAYTFTTVDLLTTEYKGKTVSTFTKTMCMHCEHPACVSVCIGAALQKTELGPVILNEDKCIGCRYCQLACPFGVPKYEFDKVTPLMKKCNLCYDRIEEGKQPACADTCPSQAILFGDREELLKLARERIKKGNGKYVDHIYGEEEAGGTSVLYISSVPLDLTALNTGVTTDEVPGYTWKAMSQIPYVLGGVSLASAGFIAYSNRRTRLEEARKEGHK